MNILSDRALMQISFVLALMVIISLLGEILHILRTSNFVVVEYREIKDVDKVAESVTIDNTSPDATVRKRNAKGHFTKAKGGEPDAPVSVMDTPTE